MSRQDVDELVAVAYQELKGVAANLRRRHQVGYALNTTALVNEAWIKLRKLDGWADRNHFVQIAARAMRQVIVEDARHHLAAKRGEVPVAYDDIAEPGSLSDDGFVVQLDAAMRSLERFSPRLAALVEYRYFAGYPDPEIAELLDVTPRTLRRDWDKARAWLRMHLEPEGSALG